MNAKGFSQYWWELKDIIGTDVSSSQFFDAYRKVVIEINLMDENDLPAKLERAKMLMRMLKSQTKYMEERLRLFEAKYGGYWK